MFDVNVSAAGQLLNGNKKPQTNKTHAHTPQNHPNPQTPTFLKQQQRLFY